MSTATLIANATQIAVNAAIDSIENKLESARRTPGWAAATLVMSAMVLAIVVIQVAACVVAAPIMMALSRWRRMQDADTMLASTAPQSEVQFPDADQPNEAPSKKLGSKSPRHKRQTSNGFSDDMEL